MLLAWSQSDWSYVFRFEGGTIKGFADDAKSRVGLETMFVPVFLALDTLRFVRFAGEGRHGEHRGEHINQRCSPKACFAERLRIFGPPRPGRPLAVSQDDGGRCSCRVRCV